MDRIKNLYFRRNVAGVASVEFFWGLGFPIVLESTFLQLFLKNLGASSFLIGIVPALFILSSSCLPILASYITRNIHYKKFIVLLAHFIPAIFIFILGWLMLFIRQSYVLPLFFGFYAIFSMTLGIAIPIWLNYLTRIFPKNKTVPGLGYMMLSQNGAKIISSFFILKTVEKYAFSQQSCALIFILTGTVFMLGALCFTFTREVKDKDVPEPNTESFISHTLNSGREVLANKKFITYLAADLDFYVIVVILSFYANYATGYYDISQAIAAGAFVACIYAGSVSVNILFGTLDLLELKQKFVLSKSLSLTSLLLLIFVPGNWSFFLVSFLLGMVRALRNIVYTPSVKKFSGKTDATSYFAMAPFFTLPIGFGFPLLFGKGLDLLAHLGVNSYRVLFAITIVFILVTFYFALQTDYNKNETADEN